MAKQEVGVTVSPTLTAIMRRYEALKLKLDLVYTTWYQSELSPEEILELNAWYSRLKAYLGKRWAREFIRASKEEG